MTQWKVTAGVPGGAIPLPVNEVGDMTSWAHSTARARMPYDSGEEDVEKFAQMLLDCTSESRTRGPKAIAMAFCPDPTLGELARIEVSTMDPSPGWPSLELKQLADFFAGPLHPHALLEPHVATRDLPAGPSVRIRQQFVTEVGEDQMGKIMHSIVYAIRPPDIPAAVVLSVAWQALYYSDQLTELADKVAETVRVG